jgi:hypothetical protein
VIAVRIREAILDIARARQRHRSRFELFPRSAHDYLGSRLVRSQVYL